MPWENVGGGGGGTTENAVTSPDKSIVHALAMTQEEYEASAKDTETMYLTPDEDEAELQTIENVPLVGNVTLEEINAVRAVQGMGLSENNFSVADKTMLLSLKDESEAKWIILNDTEARSRRNEANKVDKVAGLQLSQENFTTAEKNKLETLAESNAFTDLDKSNLDTAVADVKIAKDAVSGLSLSAFTGSFKDLKDVPAKHCGSINCVFGSKQVTVPKGLAFAKFTGFNTGITINGVAPNLLTNELEINIEGTYLVTFSFSSLQATKLGSYIFQVRRNGTLLGGCELGAKIPDVNADNSIPSIVQLAHLMIGDKLSVWATTKETTDQKITVKHGALSVVGVA